MSVALANNATDNVAAKAGTATLSIPKALQQIRQTNLQTLSECKSLTMIHSLHVRYWPQLIVEINGLECVNIEPAALIASRMRLFNGYRHF